MMRRIAFLLLLALGMLAGASPTRAQEKVHGADSVFVGPTVKIVWAVQKGASEDTTFVILRVVNRIGQYKQLRLDGVDPFSNKRNVLVSKRPLGASVDLPVPRSSFAHFPSCEIHLYRGEAADDEQVPALTIYYLGVPDTTPEFATASDAKTYLAKAAGR
jgi:hypothetical protein